MDKKTHKVFVELLKCGLTGATLNDDTRDLITPKMQAWLYNASKAHDLVFLVYYSLTNAQVQLEDEIKKFFENQVALSISRLTRIEHETKNISSILKDCGVDFILTKGAIIRQLYPVQEMRLSTDIDVIVKQKDMKELKTVLAKNYGYEFRKGDLHETPAVSPSGILVEFHHDFARDYKKIEANQKLIWQSAVKVHGAENEYALPNEMMILHVVEHMASHFLRGGCGVRSVIDLFLISNKLSFDKEKLFALLDEYGLVKFYEGVLELANHWFKECEQTEKFILLEDYIINGAIYGTTRQNFYMDKSGKAGFTISRIFVPYSQMVWNYPKLKKYPILLPYYQVKRWFGLFRKSNRKNAQGQLDAIKNYDQQEKERMQRLRSSLGLD